MYTEVQVYSRLLYKEGVPNLVVIANRKVILWVTV